MLSMPCRRLNRWIVLSEGIFVMTSLLLGFIGLVLLPILVLSMVMSRWAKPRSDHRFQEENLRFTISSDRQS
jgi:hypothetical protein